MADLSKLDVELYDLTVGDWPGELDFYRSSADQSRQRGESLLEVACGTGRVAIRLAQMGINVTGLDHSAAMLDIARGKSTGAANLRWVQADMRAFDLSQTFGLAIIPGHSFQNLHTPDDQFACLSCIRRHLSPGGTLIVHLDHQDIDWLGDIYAHPFQTVEHDRKLTHPATGQICRMAYSWAYERATQTAILQTSWEILDAGDTVIDRHDNAPLRLHSIFRNEMAHAAGRAGFTVEAVYGDFARGDLTEDSAEMIWVLRNG
jgi:ubiquinone/menaquinone biosynthesis C-methylase UbiE